MAVDQKTMDMLQTASDDPSGVDLSWMQNTGERGFWSKPGRRGLTLEEINKGSYGNAPDDADDQTMAPRGAARLAGVPRIGYHVQKKSDIWSENAAMLYEEAVQRQWSSATDIPWDELKPLPDDVERAYSQFCTFLTEVEFIAGDTPSQWLPAISNEHYEVKMFLASQIMDEARHLDVFRKRALANGGGLMSSSGNAGLRVIIEAKDFTEMSAIMHVQGEGLVQSIFRMGEYIATNEAEKRIFRLSAQDESRHVAFGVMHLKYILETEPERREEIHSYLEKAEPIIGAGAGTAPVAGGSPIFGTSLGILFGHTLGSQEEGGKMALAAFRRQLNEYMHRLEVAGMGERRYRLPVQIQALLDPPKA
ncbi:MAG TPA: ferritin-like domain-containing protein [Dehalococcoidia bacterium]|nr:ferritin-like domain-containing protein [Dehalococcoidia bacterium]